MNNPEGVHRAESGSSGEGKYFHISILPKSQFQFFRTVDVGRKGHILRVAGRNGEGRWATQAWLISKEDAHMEENFLVGDSVNAKKLIKSFGSAPVHVEGDIFKAKDRPKKKNTGA